MSFDNSLYEDIKYGTNIITEEEFMTSIMEISNVAADMVKKTLGPYGKTTIIDDGMFTYPTKDGWTVLKNLRFNDPIFNILYNILKQVSFDLVNKVGDGTTSAFIGANIFMHLIEDYKKRKSFRQSEFLETLKTVSEEVVEALKNSQYVKKIDLDGDFSDIYKIAYVSSNGNAELSRMIQEIYKETKNPNIYVSLDSSLKLSSQIQSGYKLDCNPINQKVYRNSDDGTFVLSERSMFAIFDHNVTYNEHNKIIGGLSRYAQQHNCSIFIIAPHFDDVMTNILGTAINSMIQQGQVPNIMMIQVPLSMNIHRSYLSDVVLLTNAQVFDYGKVRAFNVLVHNQTALEDDKIEDALLNTDQYNFSEPTEIIDSCVGKANKVIVDDKYIMIQDYDTIINPQVYKSTLDDVEKEYKMLKEKANKSTSNLRKDYMDAYQHYVKLFGSMGIIKVGGTSELEKHCLKDTVDDAVLACRSAFDHGYIRGLNLTTINVIDKMMESSYTDEELEVLKLLRETMRLMSMQVLSNKYNDNEERTVMYPNGEQLQLNNYEIIRTAIDNEYGYDLVNEVLMEDGECTVINSTSTDIEVIKGMVSILSTILTSNQFLSINRNYDRSMGKKQQIEEKVMMQTETAKAVTNAVLGVLAEKGIILSSLKK